MTYVVDALIEVEVDSAEEGVEDAILDAVNSALGRNPQVADALLKGIREYEDAITDVQGEAWRVSDTEGNELAER